MSTSTSTVLTGGNVLLTSEEDQQIVSAFQTMLLRTAISNFNESYGTSYKANDFTIKSLGGSASASAVYAVESSDPANSDAINITVVAEDILNLSFTTALTPVQPVSSPSTSYYPGSADPGGLGYNGVNFTKVNNVP
jgi:hypothetical protein